MGNSMKQLQRNTGDEVQGFKQVKDGKEGGEGCYMGSYVWVHLKAEADLLIFKKAGCWRLRGQGGKSLIWAVAVTMMNGPGK